MKNKKISLIYFSPTGTTKKVLDAIADGMDFPKTEQINLNKKDKIKKRKFTEDDFVIFGIPVYSGRIPLPVINRLQNFKANKTQVVLVVVYGNRHYDDALLELKDLTIELGFLPIAAAVFIGEHSFSSSKYPIAAGRPNSADLKLARDLGKHIKTKMKLKEPQHSEDLINRNIRKLSSHSIDVPGNFPYKERSKKLKVKPKTDLELCDRCGLCQEACPVDAISIFEDRIEIDENLCIYCHACVKICPQKALKIDDEGIIGFAKNLNEKCRQAREPEIFL